MKPSTKSLTIKNAPATADGVTLNTTEHEPPPLILVGIDWADGEHAYRMLDPYGKVHQGTVRQTPEAIAQLLADWQQQFPGTTVAVCVETSRGPLINALLEHPQVCIYPVNPNALANYRKAFAHGGGKSDPVDAKLILQFYAGFVVRLLGKYPTLDALQSAGRTRVRKLFFATGTKNKIEQRLDVLISAQPLSTDPVLLRTSARRAQAICGQLASLNRSIRDYDRQIEQLVKQHADYNVVRCLPCGAKTQARILAALGDDRSRFASADELAAAVGIAPLTTQSGKQRYVSSRWACNRFLRQTFHEFAGLSITQSPWAKIFYAVKKQNRQQSVDIFLSIFQAARPSS